MIDTNSLLDGYYRIPLRTSAAIGHLAVFWSPTIERELAKVVYREHVLVAVASAAAAGGNPDPARLRDLFDRLADDLESQLFDLERWFRYATGEVNVDPAALEGVTDPADRQVLRAARAAGAPYLLALDRRHVPHGAIFEGVQCWHPDTFLTLFYQQNPAAFVRAARALADTPESIRQRLLP